MIASSETYQIILTAEFSGMMDHWTQYLCLRIVDGEVELSDRVAERLMYCGDNIEGGEIVWPEGYDPDEDEAGENPLPISVRGKKVAGRDGDHIVGEDLASYDEDNGIFAYGEFGEALVWLERHGWENKRNKQEFDVAKDTIRAVLKSLR